MQLKYINKKDDFIKYFDYKLNTHIKKVSYQSILILIAVVLVYMFIFKVPAVAIFSLALLGIVIITLSISHENKVCKKYRNDYIYCLSEDDSIYPLEGTIALSPHTITFISNLHKAQPIELNLSKINKVIDDKKNKKIYLIDNEDTLLPIITYDNFNSEEDLTKFLKTIKAKRYKK